MLYRTCFILLICLSTTTVSQSVSSSLSSYSAALKVTSISGVTASQISGITFHPGSKTLYAVDNGTDMVYEIDTAGKGVRTITTSGFNDIEGIAFQTDRFFYIAEEGTSSITRISIPASGTGPVTKSSGRTLALGTGWANVGLEGAGYCKSKNTLYCVKEKQPPQLHRVTLDSIGNPVATFVNDPFNFENKSGDAADIAALADGTFLIVDQEGKKLVGYNAQGQILSELSLQTMTQPEGVACDESNGTIYVAGEPKQLFVFRSTTSSANAKKSTIPRAQPTFRLINSGTIRCNFSVPYSTSVVVEFLTIQGKILMTDKRMLTRGENSFTVTLGTHAVETVVCCFKGGGFGQNGRVLMVR